MSDSVITKDVKLSDSQLRQLLELAVNNTADGIALLDAEGKYYYMNEAHAVQFGYESPAELMGKTWEVFYKPIEIDRLSKTVFPVLDAEGTWRGETEGVKKNGDAIYQEITLTRLDDGGLICVTRILDSYKELEQQIEIRNQQVTSIIKNVTSGIILEDINRFVIHSNERLGEMFQTDLPQSDMRGSSCEMGLDLVRASLVDPEQFIATIESHVKNATPVYNEIIELKNNVFLERDFIPLKVDDKLQGYMWMYRDVTEHERTKQSLQRLVDREQELNEMRSKLVRTVSHEFKKPILNTLTGIQLLQGQLKGNGEGLYSKALDHIVEELQGLNESVSKLVKYEALYDRSEAATKQVQVRNLITNYLHYHFKLFMLGEKFEIEERAEQELINVDLDLFNLALKNIVENALKYTEHNDKITIRSEVDGDLATFTFSNPITAKTKPDSNQLGTPLYRANPGDEKGLGLGLGIVQHVTDLLGGSVSYEVNDKSFSIAMSFPLDN